MKNMKKKKTYIDSELDKFLKDYGDKNINISYDNYKYKLDTEKTTKSLKKLRNKFINLTEFKEEYNKFIDNIIKFEYYKSEKESVSFSPNQRKMRRYARDLILNQIVIQVKKIVIQVKKIVVKVKKIVIQVKKVKG